jgi:23S rRNA (cytidine1920-2'-O)/16S rRNA (cytidine1409-2'-O)-methyltransferase
MSASKERLDVLMVKRGFETTREKAKILVLSGNVFVDNVRVDKPGTFVKTDCSITTLESACAYVGRGGLKLEKALSEFDIQTEQKVFIDVGASTGGFTDCLLKHGALKVYALDVGYGQIAWKLRCDKRVVVMERTNIRNVKPEMFDEKLDGAVIDVSFISLRLVLPVVDKLLTGSSDIVALIKPQFEAGKEKVKRNGVVRDPNVHIEVLTGMAEFCASLGLSLLDVTYSPIKGPSGNIEFLMHLRKGVADIGTETNEKIELLVKRAHEEL